MNTFVKVLLVTVGAVFALILWATLFILWVLWDPDEEDGRLYEEDGSLLSYDGRELHVAKD